MSMSNEKLLTIAEGAACLGLKPSTLRAWRLKREHLPFVQLGRAVRVRLADLQALIDAGTVPPKPSTRGG